MLNSYFLLSTVGMKYRFDASVYGDESMKLVVMVGYQHQNGRLLNHTPHVTVCIIELGI